MNNDFITLEEACNCAIEFFYNIKYKTTFAGNSQLTLEEFEFVKAQKCWFITLSFIPIRREDENEQYPILGREYRIFKVNAITKQVEGMRKGFMGYQEQELVSTISEESKPQTDWSKIVKHFTEKAEKEIN